MPRQGGSSIRVPLLNTGEERGGHGRHQASITNFRERVGKLSVRQGLYQRGGEGQSATSESCTPTLDDARLT